MCEFVFIFFDNDLLISKVCDNKNCIFENFGKIGVLNFENFGKIGVLNFENFGKIGKKKFEETK